MDQDILTLSSDDLAPIDLERLEQAFLAHQGVILWQGKPYRVSAMDQNYPEDESEAIRVTFTLKPAGAEMSDEGSEHY